MTNFSKLKIENSSIFSSHDTDYVYFSLMDTAEDFLYFIAKDLSRFSLLFGRDFQQKIQNLKDDPSVSCIECNLSADIEGGVSFDTGELTNFNFSIKKANHILKSLKNSLKSENLKLLYF